MPETFTKINPTDPLTLDFTMTHTRYGRSIQHTTSQFTHSRRSDGTPESDGVLQKVPRDRIRHYRQIYLIGQIQLRS